MEQATKVYFPRWVAALYGILIIGIIPWIFNLAISLPGKHTASHWDSVWVGLDIMIFIALATTLVFAVKRLVWLAVSASILATLFVVDAWFDVMTAKAGHEQKIAVFSPCPNYCWPV